MEVTFSTEELEQIRQILKLNSLVLKLDVSWGSKSENFRELLYADLNKNTSPTKAYSISHTVGLGGYVLSTDPAVQLGFDIEITERVTPEIASRICQRPEESTKAPSPCSLWTAKESAYKALRGPHQPSVLSDLTIGDWHILDSRFETFHFVGQEPHSKFLNCGVVISKEFYTFSFFTFRP